MTFNWTWTRCQYVFTVLARCAQPGKPEALIKDSIRQDDQLSGDVLQVGGIGCYVKLTQRVALAGMALIAFLDPC